MSTIPGAVPPVPPAVVPGSSAIQSPTRAAENAHAERGRPALDTAEVTRVVLSESARLQAWRDGAVALGQRAREADVALAKAIDLVKQMKAQLSAVTKQFPPFPADSEERFRYLNGFSGLRALVESLTFPPVPASDGNWGGIRFPPERIGWDLPRLDPATADDAAVQAAEVQVERIVDDLGQRRQSLFDSVARVAGGDLGADHARQLVERIRTGVAG